MVDKRHTGRQSRRFRLPNASWSEEVIATNGIQLSSSIIRSYDHCEWPSESSTGLSLGVAHGHMVLNVDRRWKTDLSGDYGFCLFSDEPIESLHAMNGQTQLQAVVIHVPPEVLDELDLHPHHQVSLKAGRSQASKSAIFTDWTPSLRTAALARQIASCTHHDTLRSLYLQGKSLELLANMLDELSIAPESNNRRKRLSKRDIEALRHARDILIESLTSPPPLDVLARRIGMSTSRLTAGFRQLFGVSVTEFVQNRRLETAMSALTSRRMSVSQAAYTVGYTPAYFSTLFRRKFGFPPSALLAG